MNYFFGLNKCTQNTIYLYLFIVTSATNFTVVAACSKAYIECLIYKGTHLQTQRNHFVSFS